jgi:hypothetical protein
MAAPLPIVNGDFETGTAGASSFTPIAGWTDFGAIAGFWLQDGDNDPVGTGSFPQDPYEPQAGSLYLTANRLAGGAATQPNASTLSQVVAIDAGDLTLVQSAEAEVHLSFYYHDADPNDNGTVTVEYLDASYSIIGSATTGALPGLAANSPYDPVTLPWTLKTLVDPLPVATEFIRINIQTNRASGTSTNIHFDSFSAEVTSSDSDNDGLPDSYEWTIINADPDDDITDLSHVAGPNDFPFTTDFDGDGSSDADEFFNGTDPLDSDSDDDGLLDGVETNTGVYNGPTDTGTDPLNPDTDSDGFNDGTEVSFGSSPVDGLDTPGSALNILNPGFEEPVVAVSTEGVPVSGGTVTGWSVATNEMWVIDSLTTGANDPTFASEGNQFLTSNRLAPNPDADPSTFGGNAAIMSARQDVDVSSFAAAIDAGARTIYVKFDWFDNDPHDRGTVNVRFLDGVGTDLGRYRTNVTLGNPNGWQTTIFSVYPPSGTRTVRITLAAENRNDAGNPSNTGTVRNVHFDNIAASLVHADSDNDLMADDWELANGLDPSDPDDAGELSIGGNLTNLQEFLAGTDPNLADTDGDGFNDDVELAAGTDPLDAASFPVPTPIDPLVVESAGFNLDGDFEVTVSGLSTSHTYRLVRGTELTDFPDVIVEKVPADISDVFTDTTPPAGKAFYRVELVPAP